LTAGVGGRVGLFDGLSQPRNDDGANHQKTEAGDSTETSSLQILPLLIPAKHVAVISAVRSSPPPDLGLPMAAGDDGPATTPIGPPVLEPALNADDDDVVDAGKSSSHAVGADSEAKSVADSAATPLTSAASDNAVAVID